MSEYDAERHQAQVARFRQTAELDLSPHEEFGANMAAVLDSALAQMIRNDRAGRPGGVRASGLTETADLLGLP